MAGRSGSVKVSITSDTSGLERGVKRAEGDLSHLGTRGSKSLGALKTAALGAGAAITAGVVVGLKQSIDAAVEAEKSQATLQAQLKAMGISYKAHAKEIDNVIQKTSKLSGLDDEDLQNAFTNVVRATGSVNVGLRDMAVVADLARAKHMDVARAGEVVAKVHAGNIGALKRLGIAFAPVTTAQDKLKATTKHANAEQIAAAKLADKTATAQGALAELQKRLSGQAEAYGKTAAGAQDRFRVAVENLKETVGAKLLPVVTKVATKVGDFVQQMVDGKGAGGRFADALSNVYGRVKPIVEFFVKHPKYIAIAAGAWAVYKAAALAASVYTKLKLLEPFVGGALRRLVGAAGIAGKTAGVAMGTGLSVHGAAGAGKIATALKAFGWVGVGLAIASALGLDKAFADAASKAADYASNFAAEKIKNNVANAVSQGVSIATGLTPPQSSSGVQGHGHGFKLHPGGAHDTPGTGTGAGGYFGNTLPGSTDASAESLGYKRSGAKTKHLTPQQLAAKARQKAREAKDRNFNRIQARLEILQLEAQAGIRSQDRVDVLTENTIDRALGDEKHPLTRHDRLVLLAASRDAARDKSDHFAEQQAKKKEARVKRNHWVGEHVRRLLQVVDNKEATGDLSERAADGQRLRICNNALTGKYDRDVVIAAPSPGHPHRTKKVHEGLHAADRQWIRELVWSITQKYAQVASDVSDTSGGATTGLTPEQDAALNDANAQLGQASLRAAVAERSAALSGAALGVFQGAGSIGYGGPTIVFKVGETEFGRAAVQSLSSQGAATTPRTVTGV